MLDYRHSSSRRHTSAASLSWKGVFQRFSFLIFIVLSVFILIVSKTQPIAVSYVRANATDLLAPFLDALSKPAIFVENIGATARDFVSLRADNVKLRHENARMIEWQNAVVMLEKENKELKSLLKFKTEPHHSYISARVIADVGGAYTRGLVITAGKMDGVREGMAAMTGEGLIGRVVEVGDWSSRVWLITDLNSRIPVIVSETGDRAILAGDSSAKPKLMFLARDASVQDGLHVITSGHGGVFPPNLPIGILKETGRGAISVLPTADLGKINYVRLVDFKLEGGDFNAIENKIRSESKSK